jgi:hypothetical protein
MNGATQIAGSKPRANLPQHVLDPAAERRAGIQPVAHRRLIPVVDLDVLEAGDLPGDGVEVVEHLRRGHLRAEAVPRAPA